MYKVSKANDDDDEEGEEEDEDDVSDATLFSVVMQPLNLQTFLDVCFSFFPFFFLLFFFFFLALPP